MERNRTWHQPVIEIFSNLITPTVRYAANTYDLANRRWYRLDVEDPEGPADEWLAEPVASHVTAYCAKHGECPLWNVIRLPYREAGASGEAEFVWQERGVERPLREYVDYDQQGVLPMVRVGGLRELRYLSWSVSWSADWCIWEGRKCVLKRVEFDCDVDVIAEEIRGREKLLSAMGLRVGLAAEDEIGAAVSGSADLNCGDREERPWRPGTVARVLMPYCGSDLEVPARETDGNLAITEQQLRDLVGGVSELARRDLEHGDIRYWNTVVQRQGEVRGARLVLVDFGSVAPELRAMQRLWGHYCCGVWGTPTSCEGTEWLQPLQHCALGTSLRVP